jgi:hypothetical protein
MMSRPSVAVAALVAQRYLIVEADLHEELVGGDEHEAKCVAASHRAAPSEADISEKNNSGGLEKPLSELRRAGPSQSKSMLAGQSPVG